ncbi:trace amine-associated receptor 13c-like [Channa argus]|uniref:trace amine-associated receptor 13c-like n=1 Tax=Channa argus TaxID=215402 RepID=UPI003520CCB0
MGAMGQPCLHCTSGHQSVKLLKFADDAALICLIPDRDELAYRSETDLLVTWCSMNNLELNTLKTVEMIVDFRKRPSLPPPLTSATLQQLHTPTNLLLLSLAVSDFLVGFDMLFQIMLIDGCWFLGDFMCNLYFGLDYITTCTSVGIMVLISVDRYVAICDPLHYSTKVTPRRVQLCVLLCWFSSFLYTMIVMNDELTQAGRFNTCAGECVMVSKSFVQVTDFIFTFLLPITVIIVLYIRVFVVAVSQARAMRSHIATVSLQHSVKVTAKKSEIKAAGTLGVVIVVFLICMCPYFGATMTGQNILYNVLSVAIVICLYYFNSCLNPLIYAFFYPWFRKSIRLIVTFQILKPGSCDTNME